MAAKHHCRGGWGGNSTPSNGQCSGTPEDNLASGPGWLTWMRPPLSSPNFLQPELYLSPTRKGQVCFTVPFGVSLGLIWAGISHCYRVPLSFLARHRQRPQQRNPFTTRLIEKDHNFSACGIVQHHRKHPFHRTFLVSFVKVFVEGIEHYMISVTWLQLPLEPHLSTPSPISTPQSLILQTDWCSGSSENAVCCSPRGRLRTFCCLFSRARLQGCISGL